MKVALADFFLADQLTSQVQALRSLEFYICYYGSGDYAHRDSSLSSRVYPTLAVYKNAHLFVFNNGTEPITVESLDAWSMNHPYCQNVYYHACLLESFSIF